MLRREKNDERDEFVNAIRVHKYKNLRDCEFCKVFFFSIMSILRFCYFVIFPNCHTTLIFQSCTLCFQE